MNRKIAGTLIVLLATLTAVGARAQWWSGSNPRGHAINGDLSSQPERPFVLVDTERRFRPGENATARVQLHSPAGGHLQAALYRVLDPRALLAGARTERQGVAIASGPLGAEAEELLLHPSRTGSAPSNTAEIGFPRRGTRLSLLQVMRVNVPARTRRGHRVDSDQESEVYNSNESQESDVETYGVSASDWSEVQVPLGHLETGVYLVRFQAAAWSATALVSVGEMVVLARRGDQHDAVLVTDADGAPLAGVLVREQNGGGSVAELTTGADGRVRFPARNETAIRIVASRGDDIAWADVAHARFDACDPRVYMATDRPMFASGDTIHVRGHVRGCDSSGRYVPLANETIVIGPAASQDVRVRTDANGNFIAEVVASSAGLHAEVRGHRQERPIRIDDRIPPQRALHAEFDRVFAQPGDVVTVTVADDEGGWPTQQDVVLDGPRGRLMGRIGPRRPAVFHFTVPATSSPLESLRVVASLSAAHSTSLASAELWTGRSPLLVEVSSEKVRAREGEAITVQLRTTRLDGGALPTQLTISLYATDGNSHKAGVLFTGTAALNARGVGTVPIQMRGPGPWIVEARDGSAAAEIVVWERDRPAQLSERGELSVALDGTSIAPGSPLQVHVRMPATGRTWVTLEQGAVWSEGLMQHGGTIELAVPPEATGMASVVVSHIARGRVSTASSTIEVISSRPLSLAVQTDKVVYEESARAHVVIQARGEDGAPRDAVATLWMADAGYWDSGDDDYPMPGPYLRRPGRMASGADSTHPLTYGAEEGRVLPHALLEWNGHALPASTYRHAWGWSGDVIQFEKNASLSVIAADLARAGGLPGASVCDAIARANPSVSIRAVDLPWDLVVARVAEALNTFAKVDARGRLRIACPGEAPGEDGLGMIGSGSGYGSGAGGFGRRSSREQRLYGTLHFIGLIPLGPDGREELDLVLPGQPGRFRVEVLAIANDGGGDRAHAIMETRRTLQATADVAPSLSLGDETTGDIAVVAPTLAGQRVPLRIEVANGLELLQPAPTEVTLDARGRAHAQLHFRARSSGNQRIAVTAGTGSTADAIQATVRVGPSSAAIPVALRALVASGPTDVQMALPALAADSEVTIEWNGDAVAAVANVLSDLRAPRWNTPAMRIDRLVSLNGLHAALDGRTDPPAERLREQLLDAIAGEAAALTAMRTDDESLAWWQGMSSDVRLTAEALVAMRVNDPGGAWRGALDRLMRAVRNPATLSSAEAAWLALAFATTRSSSPGVVRTLIARIEEAPPNDISSLDAATRAAALANLSEATNAFASRLESAIRAMLASQSTPTQCRGAAWYMCFEARGDRASVMRAAVLLMTLHRDGARLLAMQVAQWVAQEPAMDRMWMWGTEEADKLALFAALANGQRPGVFETLIDGRPATLLNGRVRIPASARALTLRFAANAERIGWLRIDGVVSAQAPTSPQGTARFGRRFEHGRDGWSLVIEAQTRASERNIDLTIPMPAGLEISPAFHRPGVHTWVDQGVLHVRLASSPRRALTVPLLRTARGTFSAGTAVLRTTNRDVWSVVPPVSVSVTDP
jgi:hypothetical protein